MSDTKDTGVELTSSKKLEQMIEHMENNLHPECAYQKRVKKHMLALANTIFEDRPEGCDDEPPIKALKLLGDVYALCASISDVDSRLP